MSEDPRITQARKLMQAVTCDERKKRIEAANATKCQCGHRYDQHGRSHNINYSAGFCEKCKCHNFMSK